MVMQRVLLMIHPTDSGKPFPLAGRSCQATALKRTIRWIETGTL
ncbi:hypothetical protein ACSSV1_000076 [Labrenzia sp. MBR-25]|jgi:hypothetical protein